MNLCSGVLCFNIVRCLSIGFIAMQATTTTQASNALDTFRIGDVSVRPGIEAYAQVLTTAEGNTGPFYHAHGLLHLLPSLTLNDAVSLRLRTVAEMWSFSSSYDSESNRHLWAKPSVRVSINTGSTVDSTGDSTVDSITILGGDLWRIKNGQGLALDYFEALGVNLALHMGHIVVEATTAGYGWTGSDDIYMLNIRYDSLIRINAFANFSGQITTLNPSGFDRLIFSIDAQHPLVWGLSAYAEGGYAVDHGIAALAGIKYLYKDDNTIIDVRAEGRMYTPNFFTDAGWSHPYFNSLTALDKPVNTYRSWVNERSGVYFRVQVRRHIYNGFFFSTDTEYLSLTDATYTETCLGYNVIQGVDLTAGYLNKLFNLYRANDFESNPYLPMFRDEAQIILKLAARF